MIDLNPNHLETVRRILAEHVPAYEVRAFGSRATWTAKDYSDIDLAIVGPGTVGWEALSRLKEAFEESDLPIRVDVLDWHATSESFREVIERDYEVVQNQASADGTGLPGEWRMCSLGELADNFDSIRIPVKQRDRRPGPYPYSGASGVVDYVDGFLFDGEYLLIAEDGENLRTRTTPIAFVANGKFWVNNHAHIVRGNSNGDTRFLKYVLSGLNISGYLTGSTMPKLTQGNMKRISFLAPPLPEQRAIAHVLGTLDDKIELSRRMNQTLEAMARALFKSWFVDFDPVRAKATLKHHAAPLPQGGSDWSVERARASLDSMDPNIAALFPDSFMDSELGLVPEGWRVVPLAEVIEVNPPRPLRRGEIAPYLDMANMPTKGHTPETVIDRPFGSGMRFTNGDTLLARITPCLENGKTAYVDFLKENQIGWGSTEYIVLRPKSPLPSEFAYCLGRNAGFREFAIQNMTGTSGRQRVPATAISNYRMTVPKGLGVPRMFGELVEPLFSLATQNAEESRTLTALRDALLPKLVSGNLRVKQTEMTMP